MPGAFWLKDCPCEEKTAMNANASQSCFAACAASKHGRELLWLRAMIRHKLGTGAMAGFQAGRTGSQVSNAEARAILAEARADCANRPPRPCSSRSIVAAFVFSFGLWRQFLTDSEDSGSEQSRANT